MLGDGVRLILVGLLVGIPGIWMAGRTVRGILVGLSPFDVPTLAAVALGLVAVAVLACWLPARRVTDIEPARLLRQG